MKKFCSRNEVIHTQTHTYALLQRRRVHNHRRNKVNTSSMLVCVFVDNIMMNYSDFRCRRRPIRTRVRARYQYYSTYLRRIYHFRLSRFTRAPCVQTAGDIITVAERVPYVCIAMILKHFFMVMWARAAAV